MNQNRKLEAIYNKYKKKYQENPDSKQMCCMWSTNNPPDVIEGTEPFCEIEEVFGVEINDNDALTLYEMTLKEGLTYINNLRILQKKE